MRLSSFNAVTSELGFTYEPGGGISLIIPAKRLANNLLFAQHKEVLKVPARAYLNGDIDAKGFIDRLKLIAEELVSHRD